jgi:hypothetical protein
VSRLLQRSVNLIRSGELKHVLPLKIFLASEVVQAFRHFASSDRIGRVVVSLAKNLAIKVGLTLYYEAPQTDVRRLFPSSTECDLAPKSRTSLLGAWVV